MCINIQGFLIVGSLSIMPGGIISDGRVHIKMIGKINAPNITALNFI